MGLRKVSERGWFYFDPHVTHEEHAIQNNHVHQMLANKAFELPIGAPRKAQEVPGTPQETPRRPQEASQRLQDAARR